MTVQEEYAYAQTNANVPADVNTTSSCAKSMEVNIAKLPFRTHFLKNEMFLLRMKCLELGIVTKAMKEW